MSIAILIPLLIIIALLVSILGSISGIGGGILFIPALIFLLTNNSFPEIRFVSTLLVFIGAFINVLIEIINKKFSWVLIAIIIATAVPTIFLGNYLAAITNQKITQIIIIVVLIVATILLSLNNFISKKMARLKKQKPLTRSWSTLKTNYGLTINIFKIICITFLAGIITALTGIGGGPIIMPFLILACGLTIKQSTPVSHSIIAVSAFVSTCLNYQFFTNQTLNLQVLLPMVCGVVVGTIIAYFLKNKIKNEIIIKWILITLIWVAIIKMIIDVAS